MIVDLYRTSRLGLIELGRSLSDELAAKRSPACPGWSVKDLYAHQAGVAADALAGRLDGVATEAWADRQVDERAGRTLTEVLAEWEQLGPEMEARLDELGDSVDPRLVFDIWTHEQDIRGTVDRPGGRDLEVARWCAASMAGRFGSRIRRVGLAPVTLDFGGDRVTAGAAGAAGAGAALGVTRFEFLRAALGRRSRPQIAAWGWPADPSAYVDALTVFPPRDTDLIEA